MGLGTAHRTLTIVETYLAMKRGLFLHPQYFLGEEDGESAADLDFLAIYFPGKTVWMVEVTRGRARLESKIAEFARDYEPIIRQQLISDQVIPNDAAGWKIGFWAFVPKYDCERVEGLFKKHADISYFKVEALENALSLSAWDNRFAAD